MNPIRYPLNDPIPITGKLPPLTIREFRGYSSSDPLSLDARYFSDVSNLTTNNYPSAAVRDGYRQMGSTIGTSVIGLAVYKENDPFSAELHAIFNDGTWRKWGGSSWSSPLASGLSVFPWSFCSFQGDQPDVCLFAACGSGGMLRYNGSVVGTFSDAPANINRLAVYQNRIWGSSGMELRACALDRPGDWNVFTGTEEDSYVVTVEDGAGGNISTVSAGLTKLIVSTPGSLFELYGGVPSDFALRQVSDTEGAMNNQMASMNGVAYFLHTKGLFSYNGASLPDTSFADPVRNMLEKEYISTSGRVFTDGFNVFFYLSGSEANFIYNPKLGTWDIWRGFKSTCSTVFDQDTIIGDSTGRVIKFSRFLDYTDDAGAPITWHAITKPFSNNSIAQRMRWYKMWVVIDLPVGSTLNVYLSKSVSGDSDWELVQTATGGSVLKQRILIPVDKYALEHHIRIKLSGTGLAKLHEITIQQRELPLY